MNQMMESIMRGISNSGYYICVCEDCGNEFTSSTRAEETYADYTATLPASSVTSDGGILWYPTVDDLNYNYFGINYMNSSTSSFEYLVGPQYEKDNDSYFAQLRTDRRSVYSVAKQSGNHIFGLQQLAIIAPISGTYSYLTTFGYDVLLLDGVSSNIQLSKNSSWSEFWTSGKVYYVGGNDSFRETMYCSSSLSVVYYFPVFKIIPSAGSYDVATSDTTLQFPARMGLLTEMGISSVSKAPV